MSNLRDIIRRHIENETLNELHDIPLDQRPSMLDFLRKEGHIDKKVNDVLEIYQRELEKENVKYKTRRKIWKVGPGTNLTGTGELLFKFKVTFPLYPGFI